MILDVNFVALELFFADLKPVMVLVECEIGLLTSQNLLDDAMSTHSAKKARSRDPGSRGTFFVIAK